MTGMSEGSISDSLLAPPRHVERLEDCFFYHTMELPGLGVVHGQGLFILKN